MDSDLAYNNAEFIPNATRYPPRWAREAAELRAARKDRARLGLVYGESPRQALDLFLPDAAPTGLMVFFHGGYWHKFGREDWSHLALGALITGWAVAVPSYTLAPQARIREMTREAARAIAVAAGEVAGPIVVTGHSAGGHLAARMNCADVSLPEDVAGRIRRIVPISPLADLRPLVRLSMNATLRLDPEEAAAESPALTRATRGIDTLTWVGAEERPAFLDQARWLADAWPEARLHIAPGRHHFDVIEGLTDPDSPLMAALLTPPASD
jgi:acetyl esterase/lipase